MTQLLTALLTIVGVLWFLFLAVAVSLLVLALSPRKVLRRRRQVARFTRQLDQRRLDPATCEGEIDWAVVDDLVGDGWTEEDARRFATSRRANQPTTWKGRP